MFPANSHLIRPATPADAIALRRLAADSHVRPLAGRILVAEARDGVVAALSRDERRTLADPALAPRYLPAMLRVRAAGLDAFEREPDVAERMREAVLGAREPAKLPRAA